MNFFYKLEYKFGKYAVKNLNLYLVIIYLIGLFIMMLNPYFYYEYLSLDIRMFLSGQIWRVFTFIFYPPTYDSFLLLSLLAIYIYYSLSKYLIMVWGDFKFNLYILCGMIGALIGGIIVYLITGINVRMDPSYLTFSIFIAFALTFPETEFLLFFLIPIKAKYLAYFELAIYIINIFTASFSSKIAIICSLLNVIIFIYLTYQNNFKDFMRKLFKGKF